jgi:molybdenum cofactor cytidylyltransferase
VGVVLGAGLGERIREGMGQQKQLLGYRGTTLLGAAVAQAEASSLDRVIVVLGAAADDVEATLTPERATIAYNPDYERGNLSSLQVGVAAAGEHDAIAHLVADMPGVEASLIDLVVDAWKQDRRPLAVTRYRDRVGHPFVLAAATTARLDRLREPKAIWRLIRDSDPADVLEVEAGRDAPIDVDTREDYERLLARERETSAGAE